MEKVTRTKWMEDVISGLTCVAQGGKIKKSTAEELLSQHYKLTDLAKKKQESVKRRRLIAEVTNKKKVLVDKESNDKLKDLVSQMYKIVTNE